MATKPQLESEVEGFEGPPLPTPMADGDDRLESLGRFVDNLLGSAQRLAEADRRIQRLVDKTEIPEDPPPTEIPEPLPDGDDPFTDGQDPAGVENRER